MRWFGGSRGLSSVGSGRRSYTLAAPNVAFARGHKGASARIDTFERLGFRFRERQVGCGLVISVSGPTTVELGTVEDLLELQRQVGLPIMVQDGMLVIEP